MGCGLSTTRILNPIFSSPSPSSLKEKEKKKEEEKLNFKLALKLPKEFDGKGLSYKYFDQNENVFKLSDNINTFIKSLFIKEKWQYWIVYNDQIEKLGLNHTSHGHTKGILVWNESKIGYLMHSTPNFPRSFNGCEISDINNDELIFGQHFLFLEFEFTLDILNALFIQITNTNPNIYMFNSNFNLTNVYSARNEESGKYEGPVGPVGPEEPIYFSLDNDSTLIHISKSIKCNEDIYEIISKKYNINLKIQSWIRGQELEYTDELKKINILKADENNTYKTTQNHSKFAVSDKDIVIFGDLNRMKSQKTRGGSCLYIKNKNLCDALNKEIVE